MTASVTNNCPGGVLCELCPIIGGVPDCSTGVAAEFSLLPGQSLSGEPGGLWWCSGSAIDYKCVDINDPYSCLNL
jgi:hypothetical protein